MGKLKLLLMGVVLLATTHSYAQYTVVYDKNTTAEVGKNAAAQELIESQHNVRLDSIKKKHQRIAQYTATMSAIKEAYKTTMANYKGFGKQTKIYKGIVNTTYQICQDIPATLKILNANSGKNLSSYVICMKEMGNVILEVKQCCEMFNDVVNGGKAGTTMADNNLVQTEIHGDAGNFIDRYQRYNLAYELYERLRNVQVKLEKLKYMSKYSYSLSDLIRKIDPQGWVNVVGGTMYAKQIINQWKGLGL